ncbi:related to NADH2 dehydrogenase (ubiquinone) complex I 13K-A chain precursor [Ustilago sp. UG-2017b]|nr:related to NADH2 dehydrogenase (ubiquinone) complex I 13K-A chain precursor [Ustilago sp. UG-2017b]
MFAARQASSSASATRRALSTSAVARAANGFFQRPANAPTSSNSPTVPQPKPVRPVAQPHTPAHVPAEQSPNFPTTWSESQNLRQNAMKGPRFEQLDMRFQPQPLAAIEMIQREPIRLSSKRIAACDGDGGPLGHPRVFINLDKPGAKPCPYCGIRFELDHSAHH